MRIKGAGGIFDVSTGPAPTVQAGGLIVEAAQGDIGAAGDPLRIALAPGTSLTARAGGSLFIDERAGELRVAEVFARNTASLAAERSILDTRAAAVVAVNAAAVQLTSRLGDIGSAARPFALRARDGGSVGGSAAGSIDITSPADHLTVGSLVAGGDVRLVSAGSLTSNGSAPNVVGREIGLQALGGTLGSPGAFFSIDSNGGVTALADTGLWLEEWNGDLFARRIATRTGPVNVRVRNGNAIFDTLVSDDVLKLTLAGGSLSVAFIDALGVELSLLEEGARLAVGDLHVRDALRLKADHIYLPQVFHKGALDTLRIAATGNDGGLSDEVTMNIESPSPVLFDRLRAKTANIFSSSGVLQLEDTTITQDANIAHPGTQVSVVNGAPTLTRANVQLFSDGRAFRLVLTDGQRLATDAVIVDYDDSFIINAFSTENSVLRQTRKVFSVQDSQGGPLFEPDALEDAALLDFGPLGGERFWALPAGDGASVEP